MRVGLRRNLRVEATCRRSFRRPVGFQSGRVQRRAARGQQLKCRRLYLEYLVSRLPLFLKRQMKNSTYFFFFRLLFVTNLVFLLQRHDSCTDLLFPAGSHSVSRRGPWGWGGGVVVGLLKASGAPETFLSGSSAPQIAAFNSTTLVFMSVC